MAKRTYSVADVGPLVEMSRASGDPPNEELAGTEKLTALLRHLEFISDTEIEDAVRQYIRST